MVYICRMLYRLLILCCLFSIQTNAQQFTISGTVSDSTNNESIIGGVVYLKGTAKGVQTNVYGFYSLTLPAGTYDLTINYITYAPKTIHVVLNQNISMNIRLSPAASSRDMS